MNFNLCDTLEESVQLFAASARAKNIELASYLAADVPIYLDGEVSKLRQLLFCLLDNAIHFTERGEIVLSAVKEGETGPLVTMRFSVTDTGMGISQERQSSIFRQGFGTLVSCRKTVLLLGGDIGVESRVGSGSTFWLRLNFARQMAGGTAPWAEANFSGVRAMIVDRSSLHAQTLRQKLAAWNMRADHATNPQEALALLKQAATGPNPYRLVLLDMQLPSMDGWTLAQAVNAETQLASLRLIGMSSLPRLINARLMGSAGIAACLHKPIRQLDLLDGLRRALREPAPSVFQERTPVMPKAPSPPPALKEEAPPFSPLPEPPKVVAHAEVESAPIVALEPPLPKSEPPQIPVPAIEEPLPVMNVLPKEEKPKPETDTKAHFRVLVISEEQNQWANILVQLKKLGYAADAAANKAQVMETLVYTSYGLILVDLSARGMNVSELVAEIRRGQGMRKRIPIVAMVSGTSLGSEGFPAGINGQILKPITPEALKTEMARWDTPVDPFVLASLRELGKDKLLAKMAHVFLEDAPGMMEAIKTALDNKNSEALRRAAHALKSSSGHMGASGLHALCARLEASAETPAFAGAAGLLSALHEEYRRVQEALAAQTKSAQEPKSADSAGARTPAPSATAPRKRSTNKKALICDDDRTLIHIVAHVLQKQGFSVGSAENGKDGLAMIRTEKPCLIVLDIDMPMKSGLSVLEELKPFYVQDDKPYIIVLSNHESFETHEKAKSLGAQEVIVKPFQPIELNKKIETLIKEGKI